MHEICNKMYTYNKTCFSGEPCMTQGPALNIAFLISLFESCSSIPLHDPDPDYSLP